MQRLPPEWCQMCFQLSMCFLFPIISAGSRWLQQLGTIAHPPWPGEQEGLISVLLVVTGWHNVGIRNNASAERWKLSAKLLQIQIELQTINRFLQSQRLLIESAYNAKQALISIVYYSRLSLVIIASRTQFHVERPWCQRPFSIVS